MNTIFKVGDTVYDSVNFPNEKGKIVKINEHNRFPVIVRFEHDLEDNYTADGKCLSYDNLRILSFTPYVVTLKGFSQERPIEYPEIKKG